MSAFGMKLKIDIFGESHAQSIGVIIEGFPAGFKIDMDFLAAFMKRRSPGQVGTTARHEPDIPVFISGVKNGITEGTSICAMIYNSDIRSDDYNELQFRPRPGHADYTAELKYKGAQDKNGGGAFSGRMTAPLCIAGALCLQYLKEKNIHIGSHIASIMNIADDAFSPLAETVEELQINSDFPVINAEKGQLMQEKIAETAAKGDSLGGTIECCVINFPGGYGGPLFEGLENKLASAIFAIPAVKGIEFGVGFEAAGLYGSENNDEYYYEGDAVKCRSNNHGGILGGISSGMPIIIRVAVKPTPSIALPQHTIDMQTKKDCIIEVKGRHDACIVPRAVPCIEAACAIVLCDYLLQEGI